MAKILVAVKVALLRAGGAVCEWRNTESVHIALSFRAAGADIISIPMRATEEPHMIRDNPKITRSPGIIIVGI